MFKIVESGFYNNGSSFFINGGLQDQSLVDILPLIQHETAHHRIFHTSSLGLLLLMCEKVSQVDSSKDDILNGLSRYYKRMQEQIATYTEMLRVLIRDGRESFKIEVSNLRHNNKEYFKYFRKLSYKNSSLKYHKILNYNANEIQSLINCLLLIGRDAFNIDVEGLGLEQIQNLSKLQNLMSERRIEFNPNYRFKELVKSISWDVNSQEFIYSPDSVGNLKYINFYSIDDYIELVKKIYPKNHLVFRLLKSFEFKIDESNTFGLPDISHSFPFLDIAGQTYEYRVPHHIENPYNLFELENIKYIDFMDKFPFIGAFISLSNGEEFICSYLDNELNDGFLLQLKLTIQKNAILRFHDFYILQYPNWVNLLDALPNFSYIYISNAIDSSIQQIQNHFKGAKFSIIAMNGYDLLVMKMHKLFLLQPIIRQLSKILRNVLSENNSNEFIDTFENQSEIIEIGEDMMKGIQLRRNINKSDILKSFKQMLEE